MSVIDAFEREIHVQVELKIRGVSLLAHPGQVCWKVLSNCLIERGRSLNLVVDRGMKRECLVDDFNNL